MEKKTWNSILKKIAKEKGFSDWSEYLFLGNTPTAEMYEEAAIRFADQEKKAYALSCIEATTKKIEAELKFLDSESMYHPDWYECLEAIKNTANTVLL